jgi:hypothetical protein
MVGREVLPSLDAAVGENEQDALVDAVAFEPEPERPLEEVESVPGRREEDLPRCATQPQRASAASREVEDARLALVEPCGRQRPAQQLECARLAPRRVRQREDRLGVHGRLGRVPLAAERSEHALVVLDRPVVDADDASVADGMVVGRHGRVTLRVVADVQEHVGRVVT